MCRPCGRRFDPIAEQMGKFMLFLRECHGRDIRPSGRPCSARIGPAEFSRVTPLPIRGRSRIWQGAARSNRPWLPRRAACTPALGNGSHHCADGRAPTSVSAPRRNGAGLGRANSGTATAWAGAGATMATGAAGGRDAPLLPPGA